MTEPNQDDSPNLSQEKLSREEPNSPTSPSYIEDADSADLKASKKREREVSLEPATPKTDDAHLTEVPDRPTPANKKNRVKLDPTAEEDETPPSSPKPSAELSTSPPHETKVRQISRRVRGMKWEDRPPFEIPQEVGTAGVSSVVVVEGQQQLAPAASISSSSGSTSPNTPQDPAKQNEVQQEISTQDDTNGDAEVPAAQEGSPPESDSEDQDKSLKRKLGDPVQASAVDRLSSTSGVEPAKRARDDAEEDDNPREKKRPSPPPDEEAKADAPQPAAPQAKVGGFLAYAAPASPFAGAKGPSVFGNKSTPSSSASATTAAKASVASSSSNSSSSNLPPSGNTSPTTSAFSNQNTHSSIQAPLKGFGAFASSSTSTPTGTKRTGFEAFASSSSPFATAARSKSPTGFSRGNNQAAIGSSLARSKSPPRRGGSFGSSNAFKSYAGLSSPFAVATPPVKKQRQEPGSGSSSETGEGNEGAKSSGIPSALNESGSPEGSEEESEKQTFGERLRAGKDADENAPAGSDDEESKLVVTEQEVQTGEELEDTVFQVRGKLYFLSDQNAWKERGTGLLKINVRKVDGGGARLLMRKDAVYALLLNVPLFKGMRCNSAQDPRYVRFSCIENGKTVHYNVRLANAKLASDLLEEINANIPGEDSAGIV